MARLRWSGDCAETTDSVTDQEGAARRPARLLRRRRPCGGHGGEGARALRRPGLRAQGDRPQQARRGDARSAAARSSSRRPRRCPRARSSSSAPTASRPSVHEEAAARNLRTIDATCPLVTKVHHEARRFADEGYKILLIGHEGHEEVVGTTGEAPEAITLVDGPSHADEVEIGADEKVVWLSQTTLSVDETVETVDRLRAAAPAARRPAQRRHLLRHPEPPARREGHRRALRRARRGGQRQLVELRAAGRGRPRGRRRCGLPRRHRRRARRGLVRRCVDRRAHQRRLGARDPRARRARPGSPSAAGATSRRSRPRRST